MNITLKIWRQQNTNAPGQFVAYQVKDVTPDMSFLEMLDASQRRFARPGENLPLPSNMTAGKESAALAVF